MKHTENSYKFKLFEPLIIIVFWALLFSSPLLFGQFNDQINWRHVFKIWRNFIPLLALFMINRFVLLPWLFFKNKRKLYFLSAISLIAALTLTSYYFNDISQQKRFFTPEIGNNSITIKAPSRISQNASFNNTRPNNPRPIPAFANFLILAFLLVGFDAGLQISMRWANLEQEKFKLQKENIENQLAFLRNQISPHFFMNTLNNIHALVDINTEEAKKAIIKLSNLMRHLLYDSEHQFTQIKNEIEFIESYIELMRLRFTDKVKINVAIKNEIPEKTIPPLLFTSLLENAFKHGISYEKDSFVNINFYFTKNKLLFEIRNSNHSKNMANSHSGIGIENTKKRLDLIYKKKYSLDILDTENEFIINLTIPI